MDEQQMTAPEEGKEKSVWTTVTPLSKYLAMALFVILPFVGFWLGYHYAPEKVIEVDKVVEAEKNNNPYASKIEISQHFIFDLNTEYGDDAPYRKSSITNIDDYWDQYSNYRLGISFTIPRKTEDNPGLLIVEKGNRVYVRNQVRGGHEFYRTVTEPDGKVMEFGNGFAWYDDEEAFLRDVLRSDSDAIRISGTTWVIIVEDVANLEELDTYVKKSFGPLCKIGEFEETSFPNLSKVKIDLSAGQPFDPDTCFVNFGYVIRYDSERQKVAEWNLGQDRRFYWSDVESIDGEMTDSFHFIDTESAYKDAGGEDQGL